MKWSPLSATIERHLTPFRTLETRSGAVAWSDEARCFEAIVALWIFVGCSPCGISLFKGGGGRRWWSFKGASKDPEIFADARFGLSSFQYWQCSNLAPKTWSVNWTGRVHSSLMDAYARKLWPTLPHDFTALQARWDPWPKRCKFCLRWVVVVICLSFSYFSHVSFKHEMSGQYST